jgi:excisionase family DNA binding protein
MASLMNDPDLIAPDTQDTEQLQQVVNRLTALPSTQPYTLTDAANNLSIELPPSLFRVLVKAAQQLALGHSVSILHYDQELTTQQAAEVLQVSRPYLIGILEEGQINYHMVGTHRRIRMGDILAYRKTRDAQRRASLQEMVRVTEAMGLYDAEQD